MKKRQIIAHRGLWNDVDKTLIPNSIEALSLALNEGYGVELDVRDFNQEVVICHDPPKERPALLSELGAVCGSRTEILAVNIKSDGLLDLNLDGIVREITENFFFFDMSEPERFRYQKIGLTTALRFSERETPDFSDDTVIWIDGFLKDWFLYRNELIESLTSSHGKVVVVSPELHGRDPKNVWHFIAEQMSAYSNLYICTDFPRQFESVGRP